MNDRMNKFYAGMAEECAKMSRAIRLKVGCIIVKNDNILSFSWNGMPRGWPNECEHSIPEQQIFDGDSRTISDHPAMLRTNIEVLHAESNCIVKLARSHESGHNGIMYSTHSPCIECAKLIHQSGIVELYYANDYRSSQGVEFLLRCGVAVHKNFQRIELGAK